MEDCIFCKIANKKIYSEIVFETDEVIAFKDANPSAEIHILIIPKKHINTFLDIDDSVTLNKMHKVAKELINNLNLEEGYKMIFNGGKYQVVNHVHWHLMAGKMKDGNQ